MFGEKQDGVDEVADNHDDANQIYATVKEMIITLALRPGTTVREADLQEQLNVKRTPLREALRRLVHDRMIKIYPRHGIVVSTLGISEIGEIYEARLIVEGAAASLAAERRTDAELKELQSLCARMNEALACEDFDCWNALHKPFHLLLAGCARNEILKGYIEHLMALNTWFWNIFEDARGDRIGSFTSHDALVEAIAVKDPAAAEQAMRDHIFIAKERLMVGI